MSTDINSVPMLSDASSKSWMSPCWLRLLCLPLALIAIVYIFVGFYTLIFDTSYSYPVDLRLRWIEQGMVIQKINPQERTYPEELLPEMILAQRDVRGNYPPWSYAVGLVLVPAVDWTATRIYFAVLNAVTLIGLLYWLYRFGERLEQGFGIAAVVSLLAIFSVCVCLSYGQYSIIVTGLVVSSLALLSRERMFTAGLVLGVASIKPQLAGLCLLVPVIYPFTVGQKLRFALGAAALFAIGSFGIAWWVDSTPWAILQGTATEAEKFFRLSNNPLIIWFSEIFGFAKGSKILAGLVAGICAVLLTIVRQQRDLLTGFSICAILGMYWSYSRHYDVLLLVIPMMKLLALYRQRESLLALAGFLLLGSTLWLPVRIAMSRTPEYQFLFAVASVFALGTICWMECRVRDDRNVCSATAPSVPRDSVLNHSVLNVTTLR